MITHFYNCSWKKQQQQTVTYLHIWLKNISPATILFLDFRNTLIVTNLSYLVGEVVRDFYFINKLACFGGIKKASIFVPKIKWRHALHYFVTK